MTTGQDDEQWEEDNASVSSKLPRRIGIAAVIAAAMLSTFAAGWMMAGNFRTVSGSGSAEWNTGNPELAPPSNFATMQSDEVAELDYSDLLQSMPHWRYFKQWRGCVMQLGINAVRSNKTADDAARIATGLCQEYQDELKASMMGRRVPHVDKILDQATRDMAQEISEYSTKVNAQLKGQINSIGGWRILRQGNICGAGYRYNGSSDFISIFYAITDSGTQSLGFEVNRAIYQESLNMQSGINAVNVVVEEQGQNSINLGSQDFITRLLDRSIRFRTEDSALINKLSDASQVSFSNDVNGDGFPVVIDMSGIAPARRAAQACHDEHSG